MEESIGKKIKALRKDLKLTQSQLAGDEITKSMLSQIENDVASPSMKSLKYLASKLNKPVSYFLDSQSEETIENNLFIDDIKKEIGKIDKLIGEKNYSNAISIMNEILEKYNFDKSSRIFADLLYRLGQTLIAIYEFEQGEEKINIAINIYNKKSLFLNAAKANIELIEKPWSKFDYSTCLKILKTTEDIYNKSLNKDISFETEILYSTAAILSATGDIEKALFIIEKGIKLSTEKKIYYKTDELYRLYANIHLLMGDFQKFLFNIKKAQKFAEFEGNDFVLVLIDYVYAKYENIIGNPSKALEYFQKIEKYSEKLMAFYYIEKSRSYYLLEKYKEAYETIKKADYQSVIKTHHHKLDYLYVLSGKIYEGLILNKLGNPTEAIKSIEYAIDKMNLFPNNKYFVFAYKSLSEIYSKMNDFEKAFKSLKKAEEIQNSLSKYENIVI